MTPQNYKPNRSRARPAVLPLLHLISLTPPICWFRVGAYLLSAHPLPSAMPCLCCLGLHVPHAQQPCLDLAPSLLFAALAVPRHAPEEPTNSPSHAPQRAPNASYHVSLAKPAYPFSQPTSHPAHSIAGALADIAHNASNGASHHTPKPLPPVAHRVPQSLAYPRNRVS